MKAALLLCLWGTLASQDKVDLKVGDAAPVFESKDDTGAAWKSADHVGKKIVVVYFFPAAFTGG
jgi:peroxiredoxin Q/BCP